MGRGHLGEFEELILLAVLRLPGKAYGVTVRRLLEEVTGRSASIGAVHATLDRLQDKGYVSSFLGDPTPDRGGRAKRYFRVEGAGIQALADAERARAQLRTQLAPAPGGAR